MKQGVVPTLIQSAKTKKSRLRFEAVRGIDTKEAAMSNYKDVRWNIEPPHPTMISDLDKEGEGNNTH